MNPYDASVDSATSSERSLNSFGAIALSVGFLCLIPAALFSMLMIAGTLFALSDDGIPYRPRFLWSAGMSLSLVTFVCTSLKITFSPARAAMYVLGASTVFCSVIYDTFNVVELNAYTGECGNPVAVGAMFRVACFSAYLGVPIVAAAGVFGISKNDRSGIDEPCDALHET